MFYTNVQNHGGQILYRGFSNDKRIQKKVAYQPKLYVPTNEPSEWKTIKGEPLMEMEFKSIYEARDFLKMMDQTADSNVYGMRRFEYSFIDEAFSPFDHIDYDTSKLRVARLDIEVESENGFPYAEEAKEKINLIGMKIAGEIKIWGLGEYKTDRQDVEYRRFATEPELLVDFINYWSLDYPDILTGWNVLGFDIVYLVNRIRTVLGEEWVNKLSPWKTYYKRGATLRNNNISTYSIVGISILDSIDLYTRYCPHGQSQDSYKLDNIGKAEGFGGKKEFEGSLFNLYKTDFQSYVEYNIQDIELDEKIALKYDVINLAAAIAYMNRVNFEDVFTQVRMWAAIVDNRLKRDKIAINHGVHHDKTFYSGAFVLSPEVGAYEDVVSEDLTGLYPHLMMQYNLSPDTIVDPKDYTDEMREFLQKVDEDSLLNETLDTSVLKEWKLTVTPNRQFFRTDKRGFMAIIMEEMNDGRSKNKKAQIAAEKEFENEHDSSKHDEIKKRVAKFKSAQMALKVCLNSAYGALGSEFFVLFDTRIAEAITSAGRLAIRWIGKKTNEYLNNLLKTSGINYVIAQDTDSMYLNLHPLVVKTFGDRKPSIIERVDFLDKITSVKDGGPISRMIDKNYEALREYTNAYEQKMIMKREAIATRGVWTGKKRYAMAVWDQEGVRYDKPHIKIVGLESVRSTTPKLAKKAIEDAIAIILDDHQDVNRLRRFIKQFRSDFEQANINDIAYASGVQGLEKYADNANIYKDGTPQHVRAALLFNHLIKTRGLDKEYPTIKSGAKIKYVPLLEPNPIHHDIIAWEDEFPKFLDLSDYIDYNALFNRTFLSPVEAIMEANGWKLVETINLEDFL